MSGVYYEYGQLRQLALEMAIDSGHGSDLDSIIYRAEAYFSFLTSGGPGGQI